MDLLNLGLPDLGFDVTNHHVMGMEHLELGVLNNGEQIELAATLPEVADVHAEVNGPGASGQPGNSNCLNCRRRFTCDAKLRWQHNVRHPANAAKFLSSPANLLRIDPAEQWTVQPRQPYGTAMRLSDAPGTPWFFRKRDRDGNKVRMFPRRSQRSPTEALPPTVPPTSDKFSSLCSSLATLTLISSAHAPPCSTVPGNASRNPHVPLPSVWRGFLTIPLLMVTLMPRPAGRTMHTERGAPLRFLPR